ncbi:MAG: TlpA disulfide reductase family protein [Anaerolineales bacterium]|jgi:cytochrome c biogenesis protein CcmG/thiol:disulfide interchange protein DsbE
METTESNILEETQEIIEHKALEEVEDKGLTRPRWGRILIWGGLFALLVILALGLQRTQEGPVAVGRSAPDFVLTTFDGEQIDSQNYENQVVVLNFWASWCKPCEQEAADLETAWRYYQPRGDVIFLGVDYVDTEPEAKAYLEKFDITYPNGPDLGTRISQSYRIIGVPETFVIGKDGKLAHFQKGPFRDLTQIKGMVDPLLSP